MKRQFLLFALLALAPAAPSTVLVHEPFAAADYAVGAVKNLADPAPVSGNVGFTAERRWYCTNTGVVFVLEDDLGFGGEASGGSGRSIGWKSGDVNRDGSRGAYRQVADGAFPTSGTFYFRVLVREAVGAKWNDDWHRRCGFQSYGFDGVGNVGPFGDSEHWVGERQFGYYFGVVPGSGPQFVLRHKTATSSYLEFWHHDCLGTLVGEVEQGTTYLCLAKIEIGAGTGGHDRASALAVPVGDWDWNGRDEPAWTVSTDDAGFTLATVSPTPDNLQLYGAYETGDVSVAFDEIMLATRLSDAVPNTHNGTVIVVK